MPPQANDIELNQLKRTHYGLNVSLDLTDFMATHKLKWENLFLGLSAVLKPRKVISSMPCSIVALRQIFIINATGCTYFKQVDARCWVSH